MGSPQPSGCDPELTGLPGTTICRGCPWQWQGPVLVSRMPWGLAWAKRRGMKSPKCWACWPAAQPLRGPWGLLKGVLLTERAGTKVLSCVGIHTAEAGGQLGVVREAVSWEWLPGAPCGYVLRGPTHVKVCGLAGHRPP